jgi:hypothetical protein
VEARVVKPGRRFQIVDATVSAEGREVAWARANLLRTDAADAPRTPPGPRLEPGPDALSRHRYAPDREGFGLTAMDLRFAEGGFREPGPAKAWFRLDLPLVEGERPTPAQRALAAGDFGNGISAVVDWNAWLFVNTELTVHLHREPAGEWIGVDAVTHLDGGGTGLSTSVLHDRDGPFGRAAQALFVARR